MTKQHTRINTDENTRPIRTVTRPSDLTRRTTTNDQVKRACARALECRKLHAHPHRAWAAHQAGTRGTQILLGRTAMQRLWTRVGSWRLACLPLVNEGMRMHKECACTKGKGHKIGLAGAMCTP